MSETPVLKPTYTQINEALEALKALDSKNDKGDRRFKFDPLVRLGNAARMRKLTDEFKDFTEARKAIIEEHKLDKPVDAEKLTKEEKSDLDTRTAAANAAVNKLVETEVEVSVRKLKYSDLATDKNDIDSVVIAALWWLLDEIPAEFA